MASYYMYQMPSSPEIPVVLTVTASSALAHRLETPPLTARCLGEQVSI